MKKYLLVALAVFFLLKNANSQIRGGALFLGGSLGVGAQKGSSEPGTGDSKTNGLYFSLAIGKAIKENLILGAIMENGYSNSESAFSTYESRQYGAGVFLRKYMPLGKGFYLFGEGSFRGSFKKNESGYPNQPPITATLTKEWALIAGLYPGVAYAVNNKIQLEVGLNNIAYVRYLNTTIEGPNSKGESNGLDIGTNLGNTGALTVGLRFLLNR